MKKKIVAWTLAVIIVISLLAFQIFNLFDKTIDSTKTPDNIIYTYVDQVNKALAGKPDDKAINDIAYPPLADYIRSLPTLSGDLRDLPFSRPLIKVDSVYIDSEYWPGQKPIYHDNGKDSISGEKLRHTPDMKSLEGTKAVVAYRGKGWFRNTVQGGSISYRFVAVVSREADGEPWRLVSVLPYSATNEKPEVKK